MPSILISRPIAWASILVLPWPGGMFDAAETYDFEFDKLVDPRYLYGVHDEILSLLMIVFGLKRLQ